MPRSAAPRRWWRSTPHGATEPAYWPPGRGNNVGIRRCVVVTVSVTVLTDVLTLVLTVVLVLVLVLVLVDGGGVVVVVVGASLVVLGAADVAGVVGDSVTVCVVSPGAGATEADGDTPDVVTDAVVEVTAGLFASFAVNLTIA